MNRLPTLLIVAILALASIHAEAATNDESSGPKFEIKKFRFRRHNRKNFERLVIEFASKGGTGQPDVKTSSSMSGKEATINFDKALLVGSIPEALINDSYVGKSKFLGPISINTDGPTSGFSIRTFLKQAVGVDAFWLERPARLVLDVFPADSPRVDARIPDGGGGEERSLASYGQKKSEPKENPIVCYPLSAAVSATVSFHPQTVPSPGSGFAAEAMAFAGHGGGNGGAEPVICFLTSSRVVASVAYKPKTMDFTNYVPWESMRQQQPPQQNGSLFQQGPPNLLNSGGPPRPAPATPAGMPGMPGKPTSMVGPAPASIATGPKPGGGYVVTDIPPGRTQLGSPLTPPSQVQRVPVTGPPNKLPTSLGDALAAPGNKTPASTASANLLPPLK